MVMLDLTNADNFKVLEQPELLSIVGGVSLSGALVSAFTRAINAILDVGRSLGTSVRKVVNKNLCPVK